MTAAAVRWPLTIYHDGGCRLCATEMTTLVGLDLRNRLRLVDCSDGTLDAACVAAGLSAGDLSTRIHARDATGRWISGVDVFVAAYEAAELQALAALFANRRLRPLWDRLYPWIARHRGVLSRLGVHHLFKLIPNRTVVRAASDASSRVETCTGGACRRPPV